MNNAPEQRALFKKVSERLKQSETAEALSLLRGALRQDLLDAEGRCKAGSLIAKARALSRCAPPGLRVLLLGQCTTSWLAPALTAEGWARGLALEVVEGEYDNVLQELLGRPADALRPGVVALLPWSQRLLFEPELRSGTERLEKELAFWRQAWTLVTDSMAARVLQIGYDWTNTGPLGHHLAGTSDGNVALIRRLNEELRRALPAGSFFVDLEQVAGRVGRDRFYDARRYFWTKQPFSEAGLCELARHVAAGVGALVTGPKKVLVLDLDNTLWGGVVGETGPLGIALAESPDGEAYRAFQMHLQGLTRRGVLLAICSKNNREDALSPFRDNPDMVLRSDDIAHIEASWEPKHVGLQKIAHALNLGLDSFVFFDDNPAEREQIRQALPEVEVVEVPEDPAEFISSLEGGLWFEAVTVSEADTQRALQYQQEQQRRELEITVGSIADYQNSLQMRATVGEVNETNIQRVVQLIGKTNQFNVTTRRHSLAELRHIVDQPDAISLTMRLADRFGDHGLIAVLLGLLKPQAAEKTLSIDTWLMSCRVIGRTAEQFLYNALLGRAAQAGYVWLAGEYIPTKKNAPVRDLYDRLGFTRSAEHPDGRVTYSLRLPDASFAQTFIQAVE